MKVSEVIRMLQDDGWYLDRVTVAGKPSDDLAPGTLKSIFKQAGLKGST